MAYLPPTPDWPLVNGASKPGTNNARDFYRDTANRARIKARANGYGYIKRAILRKRPRVRGVSGGLDGIFPIFLIKSSMSSRNRNVMRK